MATSQKMSATAYVDHFIEESDSNIWYDYVLGPAGSQEDISASNVVFALPQTPIFKPSSKSIKNGNSEKNFECHICKSKFSNLSNLKSHRRIHTHERPYACDLCSLTFVQSSNLKAHKRLHTGERPYRCKECGKSFTRSSHLNGHKRIHSGELPYLCELCTKSFASSSQLKKHQAKHQDGTNHMCDICEESFSTLESLTLHKKLHSKDRPFRCPYCMASFRSREDLHTHKKLHPGSGSPYVCNNCGKGFKIKFCCEKHYEKCVANFQSKIEQNNISLSDMTLHSNNDPLSDCNIVSDRLKSNAREKVFLFEDGRLKEICNMESMEESIEEGIDGEEQTVIVSIDDGILFA